MLWKNIVLETGAWWRVDFDEDVRKRLRKKVEARDDLAGTRPQVRPPISWDIYVDQGAGFITVLGLWGQSSLVMLGHELFFRPSLDRMTI